MQCSCRLLPVRYDVKRNLGMTGLACLCAGLLTNTNIAGQQNWAQAETTENCNKRTSHASKHGYHHSFAGAEKWVKKFDDPTRAKWQKPEEVIKALDIEANDKIADIGAGTGYFSLRIAKAYPHATVYASDVEPSMIAYLKEQTRSESLPNHVAVQVPANKPKLTSKVNLVLVVDTYHHLDDRVTYFGALRKKLLPNGRIAIIDFTAESPEGPPPEHRISKVNLEDEMKKAGFTLHQDISVLPYQYFLIFKQETQAGPSPSKRQ
jgi:cyclopropane fatty-acyl-phospholipid synthase-like methyltransferase